MTYVTGVHSNEVPKTWPTVKKFIDSGLVHGGDSSFLLERIMRRECALWVAKSGENIIAACVTENVIKDGRKVCNIISIGGTGMAEWIGSLGMIEAWAISNDCVAMRFADCRPGWSKALAKHGYRTKYVILEKAL